MIEAGGLTRDATVDEIVDHLRSIASAENKAGLARYGIKADRAFGVPHGIQRGIARQIGRNHERAMALFDTGLREAQLIASWTADPKRFTAEDARRWAADFDSWDTVDGVADLFVDTAHWQALIEEFAADEREFVRRTAFAMMAWSIVHRKKEPDTTFLAFLPLVERHATDSRNFVRKAVSWALRSMGKRSAMLNGAATECAQRLIASGDKTAAWIGRDTLRDIGGEKTAARLAKKKS